MTELELMRKKIDEIDEKLLVLFKERLEVSKQIGILKKKYKMSIFDPEREKQIISEATEAMPDNEKKYTESFLPKSPNFLIHFEPPYLYPLNYVKNFLYIFFHYQT